MPRLDDDTLVWITAFGHKPSYSKIASKIGRPAQTVYDVLVGKTNAARLAKLQKQTYCVNCRNFDAEKGECLYGFPDLDLHGPAFARDCSMYERDELQQASSASVVSAA
jgi:hypothetical protein